MKTIILAFALILSTTGCANYGRLSKNLANDGAIVVANIASPWGLQKVIRIGGTTNSVSVSPDGTVTINPPKQK